MKALIGTFGIASAQVADALPTSELVKIVVQLVIGIISVFHLFKKPKEVKNNLNNDYVQQ